MVTILLLESMAALLAYAIVMTAAFVRLQRQMAAERDLSREAISALIKDASINAIDLRRELLERSMQIEELEDMIDTLKGGEAALQQWLHQMPEISNAQTRDRDLQYLGGGVHGMGVDLSLGSTDARPSGVSRPHPSSHIPFT